VAVTPEEIGLIGCWQVIAIKRNSEKLNKPKEEASNEIGYYVSSLARQERDDAGIGAAVRRHWSGSENGVHYRRDVTFGEDACRTANRNGAAVLASFRNLTIGVYELERNRGGTKVDSLRSWCQQQTFTTALPLLKK